MADLRGARAGCADQLSIPDGTRGSGYARRRTSAAGAAISFRVTQIAAAVRERTGTQVQPLQIAAALIEKFAGSLDTNEIASLVAEHRRAR